MPKSFHITTLGCKLNYSESSHIARKLQEQGGTKVFSSEDKMKSQITIYHDRF